MKRLSSFIEQSAKDLTVDYLKRFAFLVLLMPIGGMALAWHQWYWVLPNVTAQDPLKISRDELLKLNVANGAYVAVTDFQLDTNRISTNLMGTKEQWKEAFIPIQAADVSSKDGDSVRFVLHTEDALCPADLAELKSENELHGVVVRGTKSFGISQTVRLSMKYEGANMEDCLFLQHEVVPQTPLQTYALIALGIVMTVVGFGIWWFLFWPMHPEPAVVATIVDE